MWQKMIFTVCVCIITISCNQNKAKQVSSSKFVIYINNSSSLDNKDLRKAIHSINNLLDDEELESRINWNRKVLKDSILIDNGKTLVLEFLSKRDKSNYWTYTLKDTTKIICFGYENIDDTKIFISNNPNNSECIMKLNNEKKTIHNRINPVENINFYTQ